MSKRGRKSKYESYIKPRLNEIKDWLELGATEKEIYTNLGICKDTWIRSKNKYSELSDLVKNGRKSPIIKIKKAMYKRATGYTTSEKKVIINEFKIPDEMLDILSKNNYKFTDANKPQVVRTEITTKDVPADTGAGLILLQHWDLDEKGKPKWSRDPAHRELKKEELELKKQQAAKDDW